MTLTVIAPTVVASDTFAPFKGNLTTSRKMREVFSCLARILQKCSLKRAFYNKSALSKEHFY